MNKELADQITEDILKLFNLNDEAAQYLFLMFRERLEKLEKADVNSNSERMPYFMYWAKDLDNNPDVAVAIAGYDKTDYILNSKSPLNITALAEENGLHVTDYNWVVKKFHILTLRKAEKITSKFHRVYLRRRQGNRNKINNPKRLLKYVLGNDEDQEALEYYTLLLNDLKMLEPKYRIAYRNQLLDVLGDLADEGQPIEDQFAANSAKRKKLERDNSKLMNSEYFVYLSFLFEVFLIASPYWKDLIETLKNVFDIKEFPDDVYERNNPASQDDTEQNYNWSKVTKALMVRINQESGNLSILSSMFAMRFMAWTVALNEWNTLRDVVKNPIFGQAYEHKRISELSGQRKDWENYLYSEYVKKEQIPPVYWQAIANLDAVVVPQAMAELLNLKPADDKKYWLVVLTRGAYRNESESSGWRHTNSDSSDVPPQNPKKVYQTMSYKLGGCLNAIYQTQFKPISSRTLHSYLQDATELLNNQSRTQQENALLARYQAVLQFARENPNLAPKMTISKVIKDYGGSRETAYKWLYEFYYQRSKLAKKDTGVSKEEIAEGRVKVLVDDYHLKPALAEKIVERKGTYSNKK